MPKVMPQVDRRGSRCGMTDNNSFDKEYGELKSAAFLGKASE